MTSKIKVDNINKVSDDSNIIKKCGTTITLGASGDSIALASGASQTGFGRTGTVDWQTGSIKTSTFTAANGEGYFANTSGGAFTMNLPAGTAGNIVSVVDYTNTFQTNALTITPNGSQKIGGVASSVELTTEGQSVTFVYVDGTEGWKNVQDSTSNVVGASFITATGGTITTSGNCKIHSFTGPGTFTVCSAATCGANNVISYMIVAGGGGTQEGGGGAGGFREFKSPVTPYTASPLVGATPITVTAQGYPVVVGGGGTASGHPDSRGSPGNVSSGFGITSAGGGGGGKYGNTAANGGLPGASGGGSAAFSSAPTNAGGTGNTPPVSPAQGTAGGPSNGGYPNFGGGGGGATVVGTTGDTNGAPGGDGALTSITGSSVGYSGGGGGGISSGSGTSPSPATFGGGTGACTTGNGASGGTANRGGGGGGTWSASGTNGGSGIVIIRYKFQ